MSESEENGWIIIHSDTGNNNVKIEIVQKPTTPVPVPDWMVKSEWVHTFGRRKFDDIPAEVSIERIIYNPKGLAWLAHQMDKNRNK